MLNFRDYVKIIGASFFVFLMLIVFGIHWLLSIILSVIICTFIRLSIVKSEIKSNVKKQIEFDKLYDQEINKDVK